MRVPNSLDLALSAGQMREFHDSIPLSGVSRGKNEPLQWGGGGARGDRHVLSTLSCPKSVNAVMQTPVLKNRKRGMRFRGCTAARPARLRP